MKKIKKIVILYLGIKDENDNKTFTNPELKFFMEKLFVYGKKKDLKFYRSPICWYNSNKRNFSKVWTFENNKWKIVKNITPDVVFNRCTPTTELLSVKNEIACHFKFVSSPVFEEIVNNKFITYLLLKKRMPKTHLIYSQNDLNKKIRTLNGTRFVIKPNIGQKGIDVRILKKEEIKNIKINKPMLVQEFIDGSHGVANIVKGIHDLRIIIFDKKIFGAFIRIPQKGSLIANITQGGSRIIIKKEDVPENVIDITKEVIKKFEHFDNLFYSIDFILNKEQKAYIIEINPNTGFTVESKKHGKFFDSYYKKVANFLLKVNVK